jgi:predicted nucleic acid-binding protein
MTWRFTSKIKIALDSNATRRLNFINFLIQNRSKLEIYIPTIVQMEVGYYYLAHAMSWNMYLEEVMKWGGIFMKFNPDLTQSITTTAYNNRGKLAFRDHFRDYMIGIEASSVAEILITYNKTHFEWLNIAILTPEEFILKCYKK